MRRRPSFPVRTALLLGLLLPAVCVAAAPPAPAPARLPSGADAYLAAIRSARAAYAYRLNTAGGLLSCDSLEGPQAGQGCPEVVRRWGPVRASWVDSLARLLSEPATYKGGDNDLVAYPDLAVRFEGEGAWVELIVNTACRQFWMRSPRRAPVPGLYDRALEPMNALIRGVLPPDISLDSTGVIAGPARPLAGDYPNRGVIVEFEDPPDLIYSVEPRCPPGFARPCAGDSVQLRVWIGRNGRPQAILPVQGDSLLVQAATEAVAQWIYRPALDRKRPVAIWLDVRVGFPPAR